MNPRSARILLTGCALALVGACSDHSTGPRAETDEHAADEQPSSDDRAEAHDAGGHEEGEHGESGVAFDATRGLQLAPEVVAALGVETMSVAEARFVAQTQIAARIFATHPRVLASASVPEAEAAALAAGDFSGATFERIDRSSTPGSRTVDLILALERSPAPAVGDFVAISATRRTAGTLSVPRSAVLDGAAGRFVYVVKDDRFVRTPVTVGGEAGDAVAIADGLRRGDVVVTRPVEQLWLTELRVTKGGGHSH